MGAKPAFILALLTKYDITVKKFTLIALQHTYILWSELFQTVRTIQWPIL